VHDLLAQIDQRPDPIDERSHERQTRLEGAAVAPEPLDHACARLRDHPDRTRGEDEGEDQDHCGNNQGCHRRVFLSPVTRRPSATGRSASTTTPDATMKTIADSSAPTPSSVTTAASVAPSANGSR